MTAAQQRVVDLLRVEILKRHGSPDRYEYKTFDVDDRGSLVFVLAEVGLKGDEGTMASVFARTRRHVAIGKRDGMRLLNAVKKNVRGSACLWRLTR